jgi:uncharacterized iron-regulated protein
MLVLLFTSTSHKFNVNPFNTVRILHTFSRIFSHTMSSQTITADMESALKKFVGEDHTEAEAKGMRDQLVRLHHVDIGCIS